MTSTPQEDDNHPMNRVFDFKTRPGIAMVRPEIAKRLSAACKPPTTITSEELSKAIINHGVRPGVASVRRDVAEALAKAATPPESDWTAEDLANQRRVNAEINKALERMYIRMVVAIGAVAALLATAIHFLGKQ